MNCRTWYCVIAICFVLDVNLVDAATMIQLWLSLNGLHRISGVGLVEIDQRLQFIHKLYNGYHFSHGLRERNVFCFCGRQSYFSLQLAAPNGGASIISNDVPASRHDIFWVILITPVPTTSKICIYITIQIFLFIRSANDDTLFGSKQVFSDMLDSSFMTLFWVITESSTLMNCKWDVWLCTLM